MDTPGGLDGRSLVPLLADCDAPTTQAGAAATVEVRDYLHGEHALLGQSLQWIRAGDFKYVWFCGTG